MSYLNHWVYRLFTKTEKLHFQFQILSSLLLCNVMTIKFLVKKLSNFCSETNRNPVVVRSLSRLVKISPGRTISKCFQKFRQNVEPTSIRPFNFWRKIFSKTKKVFAKKLFQKIRSAKMRMRRKVKLCFRLEREIEKSDSSKIFPVVGFCKKKNFLERQNYLQKNVL